MAINEFNSWVVAKHKPVFIIIKIANKLPKPKIPDGLAHVTGGRAYNLGEIRCAGHFNEYHPFVVTFHISIFSHKIEMLFLKQIKGIFPCISNKQTNNQQNELNRKVIAVPNARPHHIAGEDA